MYSIRAQLKCSEFPGLCLLCIKSGKSNINFVYLTLFGDQAGPALIWPDL